VIRRQIEASGTRSPIVARIAPSSRIGRDDAVAAAKRSFDDG
jgi:hypothetical protein